MWLYRLKRLLAEREVLIGLGVLGIVVMAADLLDDLDLPLRAALIRGIGLSLLALLLAWELWLRSRFRQPLPVPVVFTEESDRAQARSVFDRFVHSSNLAGALKVLESVIPLLREDLLIRLDRANPRNSQKPLAWRAAWEELLREWEREVDRKLASGPFAAEGRCYHILPQVVLPLAFAIGASADLRRSLVLYHYQQEQFYRVLDLSKPRALFLDPDPTVPPPRSVPEDLSTLPEAEKIVLRLVISERHRQHAPEEEHIANAGVTNAELVYPHALNPESDWLPYVQWFVQKATPLIMRYQQVDICLICPSAVAFALGMAFSRTPRIVVCHWFANRYLPVFSLDEIEKRLPFD